jgi:hypothetical protein
MNGYEDIVASPLGKLFRQTSSCFLNCCSVIGRVVISTSLNLFAPNESPGEFEQPFSNCLSGRSKET